MLCKTYEQHRTGSTQPDPSLIRTYENLEGLIEPKYRARRLVRCEVPEIVSDLF